MCKFFPKSDVYLCGLCFTVVFLCCAIACAFLSGYSYLPSGIDFLGKGPWRKLRNLQVSSTAIMGYLGLMTLFLFIYGLNNVNQKIKCFDITSVLLLLSSLLSIATGIFVLVGSQLHTDTFTNTCERNTKGFFKYFNFIDEFIQESDKLLCSDICECHLYNRRTIDAFLNHYNRKDNITYNMYKSYIEPNIGKESYNGPIQIDEEYAKKNVIECGEAKVYEMLNNMKSKYINDSFSDSNKIKVFESMIDYDNFEKFRDFMDKIETSFKCTGWCNRDYKDGDETRRVVKYVFSDINKGLPKGRCYEPVTQWMSKMHKAFGSLMLIGGVFQILSFICSFSVWFGMVADAKSEREKNDEDDGQEVENQ